jgi:hypothetical protein
MKRFLALVSLLTIAAACATQPSGNKDITANANTGSEKKSAAAAPSEAEIEAIEKASWDDIKKKDWEALGKLFASDFIEVLDDGVHDKAATLADVKNLELSDVSYADWKMTTIDKDAVFLTYTTNLKGTYKGQAIPPGPYHEASAYVNRNGEWVGIYYQETLSKPAMPTPPPAKTEAKTAASPMAKPAETGPDVAANEKLVWDALKAKNYDAFASYLASDSIEIEADGVYDKAGSVKGVTMMDLSKAELSDWKTVKFDNDASVVTYKVKLPGMKPDTENHSTIWVNRGGKWQALFHMGTPTATTPMTAKPETKKM